MSEAQRGCGYRKVGGLYLCGEGIFVPCDRLPYELKSCPVCGAGIHFTRSMTEINPLLLFGTHDVYDGLSDNPTLILACKDLSRPCPMCDPTDEPAFIKTVGKKYYSPQSFMSEARTMGISLRIAQIPKNLKLGETVIYLAHPQAIVEANKEPKPRRITRGRAKGQDTSELMTYKLAIFSAFIPKRVEMPVYDKMLNGKGSRNFKKSLKKRGITPVVVKGREHDPNYKPRKKKKGS